MSDAELLVPKHVVEKIHELAAKILGMPTDDVIFNEIFETNYKMAAVRVVNSPEENYDEEVRIASELSKILQVPICLGSHEQWTVDEYINGKFVKELEIDDDEDETGFPIIRFIDPPEGMTEP